VTTTTAAPPSWRRALAEAAATLARAGVDTPAADAEWLLAAVLGVGRARVHLAGAERPTPAQAARFRDGVRRRAAREPLQHIVGATEFWGLPIRVSPAVLVPRPETEALVEWVLALAAGAARPRVVDVGTGSGCIACAVATARPDARVVGLDRSAPAADVARDNVRALGLAGRVAIVQADLLDGVRGASVDVVVANPPYLPAGLLAALPPEVREHEPRIALDGGPDGLDVVRRLVPAARRALRPGGILALETAGEAQAEEAARLLGQRGFAAVQTRSDLAGVVRFVAGAAAS
jgi:release factor glutamine methyltransferase